MTKKRVSLLFLLMLCNAASVRAEFGFGFFTGLLGLVKSMQTAFSSTEDYYNSLDKSADFDIKVSKKPSKGWFKRGLQWVKSQYGFITSEIVERLRAEVSAVEKKLDEAVQNNNDKFNQLEKRFQSVQTEGNNAKEFLDQFCMKLGIDHQNYSKEHKEIKEHIEQDSTNIQEKIRRYSAEADIKINENKQYCATEIGRIKEQNEKLNNQLNGENGVINKFKGFEKKSNELNSQQETNVKQMEEELTITDFKVNTLSQSVQMLTQDFYQAKQTLLGFFTNLSVEEFKRLKELNFKDPNHNSFDKGLLYEQKIPYQISSKEASSLKICKENEARVTAAVMINMANIVNNFYMKTNTSTNEKKIYDWSHFNAKDCPD